MYIQLTIDCFDLHQGIVNSFRLVPNHGGKVHQWKNGAGFLEFSSEENFRTWLKAAVPEVQAQLEARGWKATKEGVEALLEMVPRTEKAGPGHTIEIDTSDSEDFTLAMEQALKLVPEFGGVARWSALNGKGEVDFPDQEAAGAWLGAAVHTFHAVLTRNGWNAPVPALCEMLGVPEAFQPTSTQ